MTFDPEMFDEWQRLPATLGRPPDRCQTPPGKITVKGRRIAPIAQRRNAAELGAERPGQGGHACGVAAGEVAGPLVDRGDP
jgi:hypothetical protein